MVNPAAAPRFKYERNRGRLLKGDQASVIRAITRSAGAFVNTKVSGPRSFSAEDILWAIGVWWVILTMTPVIIFYILMVA